MMKLIINGRFLSQQPTGVQNYAAGIVKALLKLGMEMEIVCPPGTIAHPAIPTKYIGYFSGFIWEQFFLPIYMCAQKGALLLNLCNSAPLFIRPQIVTIHDLAFEEKNNWFNPVFKWWYKFLIPKICKRAKLIITVSEFSKNKIIEKYGISESKIILAPPGIPEFKFKNDFHDYGNYILLTGANNHRKNAGSIIEKLEMLKEKGFTLVVLGGNSKIFRSIPIQNNDSLIYLNPVSFSEYCSLVKNAKALIYPSIYEGFGIPVLESLCLGTPVIASDIPVFKENFGTLPIYFEPGEPESFAKALDALSGKKISAADIEFLKNKFNFDISAHLISDSIKTIL